MPDMSVIMVDDDPIAAGIILRALENQGIAVSSHSHGCDALRELRSGRRHGAMLIDLTLPDMDGIELLREVRRISPRLPCFILTARDQAESAVNAMKAGADDYFTKPIDIARLVSALRGAMAMVSGQKESERLDYLAAVHGRWKSAAMKNVYDQACRAALTDRPVILTGPSHSGKGALARFIHSQSKCAADPFVCVDLAARTPRQAEIELFGVDLTGCEKPCVGTKGRLNRSGKGTVYLAHIEMLRPCAQFALLQRLAGSSEALPEIATPRLIATTSADMQALVSTGKFRSDLWYALSIHRIPLPSLAERVEDIPQLCEEIITSICVSRHLRRPTLTRKALETITRHSWPGNLAELQSALEHAVATTGDGLISPSNLADLGMKSGGPEKSGPVPMPASSIDEITKVALVAALDACNGNRRLAAERLKVSLRTVYNMINRYGLKGSRDKKN
ncbi:MAG: sigma-54-dependent transcriptional regulator [Luteolibacter sp.]